MEVKLTETDGRYLREMFAWFKSSEWRRRHKPEKRSLIGSSGTCKDYWIIDVRGGTTAPSSGKLQLDIVIQVTSSTTASASIDIQFDDTVAEVITSLEGVANLLDGDSALIVSVAGGTMPVNSILIANLNANAPKINSITTVLSNSTLNAGVYPHVSQMTPAE